MPPRSGHRPPAPSSSPLGSPATLSVWSFRPSTVRSSRARSFPNVRPRPGSLVPDRGIPAPTPSRPLQTPPCGSALGVSVPTDSLVPSSWFLTTSTGFSATAPRACCIPQPVMGFAVFLGLGLRPDPKVCRLPAPFPTTRLDPSKEATHRQPHPVTRAVAPLAFSLLQETPAARTPSEWIVLADKSEPSEGDSAGVPAHVAVPPLPPTPPTARGPKCRVTTTKPWRSMTATGRMPPATPRGHVVTEATDPDAPLPERATRSSATPHGHLGKGDHPVGATEVSPGSAANRQQVHRCARCPSGDVTCAHGPKTHRRGDARSVHRTKARSVESVASTRGH